MTYMMSLFQKFIQKMHKYENFTTMFYDITKKDLTENKIKLFRYYFVIQNEEKCKNLINIKK